MELQQGIDRLGQRVVESGDTTKEHAIGRTGGKVDYILGILAGNVDSDV